jgi:hypothetical protein
MIGSISQLSPDEVSLCQQWVRKVAKYVGVLPSSFVLDGVKKSCDLAVNGGGFADVYEGTYQKQKVAIKVIRVFLTGENRKRIHRVSTSFPNLYSLSSTVLRRSLMKLYFGNIWTIHPSSHFMA